MIAIICGGRDFTDRRAAFEAITNAHLFLGLTMIVEGGQRTYDTRRQVVGGGDYWAYLWAKMNGIPVATEPAEWKRWGKAAGAIRNGVMLRKYQPDIVLGLPGGPGTLDMLAQAKAVDVPALQIGPWPARIPV